MSTAEQLAHALQLAESSSNDVQQQVLQTINQLSTLPTYSADLILIFGSAQLPASVRQRAGLLLKAMAPHRPELARDASLRTAATAALGDTDSSVRKTAGSLITVLVSAGGGWPEVVAMLAGSLETSEGALDALAKVCEDTTDDWRAAPAEQRMQQFQWFFDIARTAVLPGLFKMTRPGPACDLALQTINFFALNFLFMPGFPLEQFLQQYFETLGRLAVSAGSSQSIAREVCKGFVYLATHHDELFVGSADVLIEFMMNASVSPDYRTRLNALEFWPCASSGHTWQDKLPLSRLLPALLDNMVYSAEDFLSMDESLREADNAAVPDKAEEMAPRFHKATGEADDEDEMDDEEEGDEDTWGKEWTVRKAAANALDQVASNFESPEVVTELLLPMIEGRLSPNQRWEVQESAILALGAIAMGCMQSLEPHLLKILEVLLTRCLSSTQPLVRSITCWTVGRFSTWIVYDVNRLPLMTPLLSRLLPALLDANKAVQNAACSALATLVEDAGPGITEHLALIIPTVMKALDLYQAKNLLILLDTIATLFRSVADVEPLMPFLPSVLPQVFAKFESVTEREVSSFVAISECVNAIVATAGRECGVDKLRLCVVKCGMVLKAASTSDVDRDMLAASLDLLSGLIEGLANDSLTFLRGDLNFTPLMCLLLSRMQSEPSALKQSAIALLGDVSKHCLDLVDESHLAAVILPVAECIVSGGYSVSNNAAWALGEIALKKGSPFMDGYAEVIGKQLMVVLTNFEKHRPLFRQNAAIAMGNLGICSSNVLVRSGIFDSCFTPFCTVLTGLNTNMEKTLAISGFLNCAKLSGPRVGDAQKLSALLKMAASLYPCPPPVQGPLREVLGSWRAADQNWRAVYESLTGDIRFKLKESYSME